MHLACAALLTESDWKAIAQHRELADYIDAADFESVRDQMLDGSWYRRASVIVDPPDHADATVDFGGGE